MIAAEAPTLAPQVLWAPQPGPQTALLECPVQDIFYGGARGGGKTDGVIGLWISHAARWGGHAKGIIFRRYAVEFADLEERAHELLVPLGWSHNLAKHEFRHASGAVLRLRHLEKKIHAKKYQGHQYTFMAFEELTAWPSPEPIDELWACLRSAHGVECVRVATGNPGGPGHTWVKQRYIEPSMPFQPFKWQPQPELRPNLYIESVFIPATLDDNLLLTQNDPHYEDRIAAAGGAALFRAWRYGDWDAVEGAAFEEWRRELHVVSFRPEKMRQLEVEWAGGLDWGYKSWSWFGLAAFFPEKQILWRKEWYFKKVPPYDAGYKLGEMMKGWRLPLPQYIACDSAMFNVTDGGQSIGERFQNGLNDSLKSLAPQLVPAPKGKGSRQSGKVMVHEALSWGDPDKPMEIADLPAWLRPHMRFHADCKHAIRTLPALPTDPNNPEDVDTEAEDHPYDGIRYLLLTRHPEMSRGEKPPEDPHKHPGIGRALEQLEGRQLGPRDDAVTEWRGRWSRIPAREED